MECPICLDSTTCPVALRCMHNICATCADELYCTHKQRKRRTGGLLCPVCRQSSFHPFVTNWALRDLLQSTPKVHGRRWHWPWKRRAVVVPV